MSTAQTLLAQALATRPPQTPLVIAYSGGLDSTCLLHAALQLARAESRPLRALHINHGLNPRATDWQRHCQQVCAALNVGIDCIAVDLPLNASEDAARRVRYAAFAAQLADGELLLLAQHLDDQLETLLLRLLRGAGPGGLAGMPARRRLGKGQLLRPWLALPRSQLQDYARQQQLSWVEDDANASIHFDRNYCRHEVLPRLAQRWPDYRASWQKSQTLLRESDDLMGDLADLDLQQVAGDKPGIIKLEPLRLLSPARQRNVLRFWLQHSLGLPRINWQLLHRLTADLVQSDGAGDGLLEVGDYSLQAYQQQLFALHRSHWQAPAVMAWSAVEQTSLALPDNGRLSAQSTTGNGLARPHAATLQVRYRQGGETLQLPGRPNKPLKKIFQEQGIPPWLRERLPLLYCGNELACVPGVGVAANLLARPGQPGLLMQWQHPELVVSSRARPRRSA